MCNNLGNFGASVTRLSHSSNFCPTAKGDYLKVKPSAHEKSLMRTYWCRESLSWCSSRVHSEVHRSSLYRSWCTYHSPMRMLQQSIRNHKQNAHIDCKVLFQRSQVSHTRGNSIKLSKHLVFSRRDGHIFANLVINIWNQLPDRIVTSPSVACFKRKLSKFHSNE